MAIIKDSFGDEIEVIFEAGAVLLVVNDSVGGRGEAVLRPKKARRLAAMLLNAADEKEAYNGHSPFLD